LVGALHERVAQELPAQLASLAVGLGLGHQRSPRVRRRGRAIVRTMIHLGMFTMPFHHPARDYTTILDEDQEAILLADRLGFTEVFVGEHFSSWSERITSPLIFLATLINRTERIKFGTGDINMAQMHPATVAAHVAMFDQLCRGRFIFVIGPGGLVRDFQLFTVADAELLPPMNVACQHTVLHMRAQDPPYRIR